MKNKNSKTIIIVSLLGAVFLLIILVKVVKKADTRSQFSASNRQQAPEPATIPLPKILPEELKSIKEKKELLNNELSIKFNGFQFSKRAIFDHYGDEYRYHDA